MIGSTTSPSAVQHTGKGSFEKPKNDPEEKKTTWESVLQVPFEKGHKQTI